MADLRYPIGKLEPEADLTPERRRGLIEQLAAAPARLRAAVSGLSAERLDTPYRPGGWTVRQVVHHLPDSHMNGYIRFKLALTEEEPLFKPYDQTRWAETEEARTAPPDVSLALLDALHARWLLLIRSLEQADFARTLRHPDTGVGSLDHYLQIYAWHGRHHVAQITSLRDRMDW